VQRNNVSTIVTRGGWHRALAISRNSPASIHVHTHLSAKPHKELLSSPLAVSDERRTSWRRISERPKRGRQGKEKERKERDRWRGKEKEIELCSCNLDAQVVYRGACIFHCLVFPASRRALRCSSRNTLCRVHTRRAG